MSAQDPRPAPRRRKLVLRKIADGPAEISSGGRTADSIARSAPAVDSAARSLAPSDGAVPAMPVAARTSSGTRIAAAAPTDSSGRISETAARTPPASPSSSYSGPLSTLRHAPQTPRVTLEPEEAQLDEEAPEEAELLAETPSRDLESMEAWPASEADAWPSPDAGAFAAMTPRAPSPVPTPVRSTPAWSAVPVAPAEPAIAMPSLERTASFPPALGAAPGRFGDPSKHTSVAPVVASLLPPMETGPQLPPTRRRLSADSKLLAAGGALAAAMLLVALGVLLGQRSASPETSSAAASAQYPVVMATKAPGATAMPAAAAAIEARPASPRGDTAAVAEKNDAPATIDVQQLPTAPRPRPQGWSVVPPAPKAASGGGWTVAASPAAHPAPAKVVDSPAAQAAAVDPSDPAAATPAPAGSEAPAASASAAPLVDPLVQAVREDIREDEARTK